LEKKFLQLLTCYLEVFQVREYLNNLAGVLRAETFDKGLADFLAEEFVDGLNAD